MVIILSFNHIPATDPMDVRSMFYEDIQEQ